MLKNINLNNLKLARMLCFTLLFYFIFVFFYASIKFGFEAGYLPLMSLIDWNLGSNNGEISAQLHFFLIIETFNLEEAKQLENINLSFL